MTTSFFAHFAILLALATSAKAAPANPAGSRVDPGSSYYAPPAMAPVSMAPAVPQKPVPLIPPAVAPLKVRAATLAARGKPRPIPPPAGSAERQAGWRIRWEVTFGWPDR